MKKSNKILLAGFLFGLLFISAIHITLYAKYRAGNYTIYNEEAELKPEAMQSFPNILFVSFRNVSGVVRFSDAARVPKGDAEDVRYVQKGDTLLITGIENLQRGYIDESVNVDLPYNATMSLVNSALSFERGDKMAIGNTVILLKNSEAAFLANRKALAFGNMRVEASDSSTVAFIGNTQIDRLDVRLSKSSIEYLDGNFNQLSIVTDSVSRISLQSKHLVKAKITTVAQ